MSEYYRLLDVDKHNQELKQDLEYYKRQNKRLKEKVNQLETNNNTAINFIDQVLQYHLSPFDYKQVDEDINTLIGILRSDSDE